MRNTHRLRALIGTYAAAAAAASVLPAAAGATVYALDYGPSPTTGGGIWQFSQGPTGALSPLTPASIATPMAYARGVAVSPDGKSAYVTEVPNPGTGRVAQFSVNPDGTLTPKTPATVSAGTSPGSIAVSPDGKSVYVDDVGFPGLIWEYDVNADGTLKPKSTASTSGTSVCGLGGSLVVTPDSKHVYVARGNPSSLCYAIAVLNADANGLLTESAPESAPPATEVGDLALSPDGTSLYAIDSSLGGDHVYQYTVGSSGALTAKSPASVNAGAVSGGFTQTDVAVSPNGHDLYITADENLCNDPGGSGEVLHYAIGAGGLLSSTPTTIAATAANNSANGVALSNDGKSLYVTEGQCAGSGGAKVLQYDVAAGGSLADKSPFTVMAGPNMVAIAVSPGGETAQHGLTVSVKGSGSVTGTGISCPGTCSSSYPSGTVVALTAKPGGGSSFSGWSGACSGTGGCMVTLTSDQTVAATFKAGANGTPPSCTLRVPSDKVLLKKHKHAKVKPGTLSVSVKCDQAASVTLSGELTERTRGKHGKKTVALGRRRGQERAGAAGSLDVTLPKSALRALGKGAKESIAFALKATNSVGTSTTTVTVKRLKAG